MKSFLPGMAGAVLVALAFAVSGCAGSAAGYVMHDMTHQGERDQDLQRMIAQNNAAIEFGRLRPFLVSVESNPPGAVIEMNGEMQGRTPCTIQVPGRADRTLAQSQVLLRIIANPVENGQFVQSKFFLPGDRVPGRVYFDMRLGPAPRQIDVNVH